MKLFVFGSTGDLVRRKVFPALEKENIIELKILAIGRKAFNNSQFLEFACKSCNSYFKDKINYLKVDFEEKDFNNIILNLDKNEINYFYISLPPESIEDIIIFLKNIKEKGYKTKILIEKPFGKNLEHARKLKSMIKEGKLEKDIFISDHYLFKKEILELKNYDFKKLKLISIEKVGLEGRIGYYNDIGALKDMIQSHFMNVLLKIHKIKNIKNLIIKEKYFGQYGNGINDGYIKELGGKSDTETYSHIKFLVNDKEIEFITGKKFNKKETILEIDSKKIEINDENPYGSLFKKFFNNEKEFFPTIENSILAWKILSKIKKESLFYYPEEISLDEIFNLEN